jgi:hypothetical protein
MKEGPSFYFNFCCSFYCIAVNLESRTNQSKPAYVCCYFFVLDEKRRRGSSVSIVSGYRMDDRGSIPIIGKGFFL